MKEKKQRPQKQEKAKKGGIGFYTLVIWMIIVFLLLVLSICLYEFHPTIQALGSPVIIVCAGVLFLAEIALGFLAGKRFYKQMRNNTIQASFELNQYYLQMLDEWVNPTVIFGSDGRVRWRNKAFCQLETEGETLGKRMEDLGVGLEGARFNAEKEPYSEEILWNGRYYRLLLTCVKITEPIVDHYQANEFKAYLLSLRDITKLKELTQENFDLQPIVFNIKADNYEYIMENLEETEKAGVMSGLYQSIANLANQTNGFLIQPLDDHFYVVFHQKKLDSIESAKFKVLSEVRDILKDATIPLTLSIGVGVAYQLKEAFDLSKEALQLAQRRGGDQAVVKDGKGNTRYSGGKTNAVEKQSQVQARSMASLFKENIRSVDRVVIMGHKDPDLDALGSSLGLYRMAKLVQDKPAHILMGKNQNAVQVLSDRLMEQEQADLTYIDERRALEYMHNGKVLLIVTDVNVPKMVESQDVLNAVKENPDALLAVLDHHRVSDYQITDADLSYIDPGISSASEMVTEMMRYISHKSKLTAEEADGLLAGIMLDTRSFTVRTGERTFEAAAYLREAGADADRVKVLFKTSLDDFKEKSQLVASAHSIQEDVMMVIWEPQTSNWKALAASVADELITINGINLSLAISKREDGVFVSLRSNATYNVQRLMEMIPKNEETKLKSGGGNAISAAAVFEANTTEENIIQLFNEYLPKLKEELA